MTRYFPSQNEQPNKWVVHAYLTFKFPSYILVHSSRLGRYLHQWCTDPCNVTKATLLFSFLSNPCADFSQYIEAGTFVQTFKKWWTKCQGGCIWCFWCCTNQVVVQGWIYQDFSWFQDFWFVFSCTKMYKTWQFQNFVISVSRFVLIHSVIPLYSIGRPTAVTWWCSSWIPHVYIL